MYQTNSTYQILINKGCTRYLSVIGDLKHELPLAVPVFHHIAGLQRNAHKQVRSDHTHRTKLEGIQGRGSGVTVVYNTGVSAEELHGPLHELIPRIHVHHHYSSEGQRRHGCDVQVAWSDLGGAPAVTSALVHPISRVAIQLDRYPDCMSF